MARLQVKGGGWEKSDREIEKYFIQRKNDISKRDNPDRKKLQREKQKYSRQKREND